MIWVIDTSALIRLFVPDGPIHPEVETAFNRVTIGADLVLAPQLLLAEAATYCYASIDGMSCRHRSWVSFFKRLSRCQSVFVSMGLCFFRPVLW